LNTLLAAAVNESVQLLLKGKDMVTSAKSDNTTVAVKDAPEHSVLIHSRKLAQLFIAIKPAAAAAAAATLGI
jgi:hypothetical protein